MKRLFISFIAISYSICMEASTDSHLRQMVNCINDSNFECASKQLMLVEDWSYDSIFYPLWDLDKAIMFIDNVDSIKISKSRVDSLRVCVIVELVEASYILFDAQEEHDTIIAMLHKALKLQEDVAGKESADYVIILEKLGDLYEIIGNKAKAKQCYIQVADITRIIYGEQSSSYASALNKLGLIYSHEDLLTAEKYYLHALSIMEENINDDNYTYILLLHNIGMLYDDLGRIQKAKEYVKKSLDIYKKTYGENDTDYAQLLTNYGTILAGNGEWLEAESSLMQAKAIIESLGGNKDLNYAYVLGELGDLYCQSGDFGKASQCIEETLMIWKGKAGEKNIDYAKYLSMLGRAYDKRGLDDNAEQCLLQSISISKETVGTNNFQYLGAMTNLGLHYNKTGNYDLALDKLREVAEITKEQLGPDNKNYATAVGNIALVYGNQKKYTEAEKYYLQALEIRKKTLDKHHPQYAQSYNDLGLLYMCMEKDSLALPYYLYSTNLIRENYIHSLNYMSEAQRTFYWNSLQTQYSSLIYSTYLYRHFSTNHILRSAAYDDELFSKGLLLTSSNVVRNSIMESGDTTLIQRWKELTEMKQQIIRLEEKNPQSPYLVQLREEAENLEKSITKSSAAYREDLRQWNITWDSVKAALKPDQVAIEYMTAPLNEDSTVYCALLLRDTCSAPILIPLFEEKEVAGLLNTSTADSADIRRTYAYADNGKKLSAIIWQHITPYLNTNDEVFFSPTGVLHQIAIENLPLDSSRIMAEAYQLVRLSSTRELVLNKPSTPHEKAALYGNIYYTADEATMLAYHQPYEHIALSEDVLLASNTRSVQRGSAKNLPGTKKEIDSIAPILQKKHVAVQIYTAYEANEESLKSLSGTHQNILHLATHGFYWPDSTAQKEKYFTQRTITEATPSSIDPLERCGLLFAGANNAYTGHRDRVPEKVQDGILTAKEISLLDFRKADVVVLSACETGLGDISGDGVFGLQRAFKMAGAQTLLMALWQVSDDATQRLMTAFYRHMSDGLSKREAFRRAQQEVRNYTPQKEVKDAERGVMQDNYKKRLHPAANGGNQPSTPVVEQPTTVVHPYASPYYWAGFVLLD